jgi:hypothetical protein
MGLQLLQNTEIIKKLTYYFGKSEENMSHIYLAVNMIVRLTLLEQLIVAEFSGE